MSLVDSSCAVAAGNGSETRDVDCRRDAVRKMKQQMTVQSFQLDETKERRYSIDWKRGDETEVVVGELALGEEFCRWRTEIYFFDGCL